MCEDQRGDQSCNYEGHLDLVGIRDYNVVDFETVVIAWVQQCKHFLAKWQWECEGGRESRVPDIYIPTSATTGLVDIRQHKD